MLRISPPLIATEDNVDEALLDYAFAEVQEMVLNRILAAAEHEAERIG